MCCGDTNKANESNHVSETYAHRLDMDRRKAIESPAHRLLEVSDYLFLYCSHHCVILIDVAGCCETGNAEELRSNYSKEKVAVLVCNRTRKIRLVMGC